MLWLSLFLILIASDLCHGVTWIRETDFSDSQCTNPIAVRVANLQRVGDNDVATIQRNVCERLADQCVQSKTFECFAGNEKPEIDASFAARGGVLETTYFESSSCAAESFVPTNIQSESVSLLSVCQQNQDTNIVSVCGEDGRLTQFKYSGGDCSGESVTKGVTTNALLCTQKNQMFVGAFYLCWNSAETVGTQTSDISTPRPSITMAENHRKTAVPTQRTGSPTRTLTSPPAAPTSITAPIPTPIPTLIPTPIPTLIPTPIPTPILTSTPTPIPTTTATPIPTSTQTWAPSHETETFPTVVELTGLSTTISPTSVSPHDQTDIESQDVATTTPTATDCCCKLALTIPCAPNSDFSECILAGGVCAGFQSISTTSDLRSMDTTNPPSLKKSETLLVVLGIVIVVAIIIGTPFFITYMKRAKGSPAAENTVPFMLI